MKRQKSKSGNKPGMINAQAAQTSFCDGNTIEEIYDRKNNAFDLLRFLFATMVIYSHCYPLLQGEKSTGDLLARLTAGQTDCGVVAVIGFFIISGFLRQHRTKHVRV